MKAVEREITEEKFKKKAQTILEDTVVNKNM
jgi:hypothetical protein